MKDVMRIHDDDMPDKNYVELSPEDEAYLEEWAAEDGVSTQVLLARLLMPRMVADGVLTEQQAREVIALNEFLWPRGRS